MPNTMFCMLCRLGSGQSMGMSMQRHTADSSSGEDDTRQHVLKMQEQLSASQMEVQEWKLLHQELHTFCVDKVLSAQ